MSLDATIQGRIDTLARGLKQKVSPKLGYTTTRVGRRVSRFTVHTLVLGDLEIPVQPGRERAAQEKLLHEIENLARHYKPSLLLPPTQRLPTWLNSKAFDFVCGATPKDAGIHRFGNSITIPGKPPKQTCEQIVYVWRTGVEAFRYFPVDQNAYKREVAYRAAMDWNRSMYNLVEEQKRAPTVARDRLVAINRELHKELILGLAVPGWGDATSVGGDIIQEVVRGLIRF